MTLLVAGAIAFGVVFLVELPDKTLVATVVLSTRFRPRPVLLGVGVAFAAQCALAAAAGGLITMLPRRAVEAVVAALFAVGALLLIRESLRGEDEHLDLHAEREALSSRRVALTSFGVLFAAEWGDASQIATAGLVARAHGMGHAVATGVGAWLALVSVAVVAVVVGKAVLRLVPVHLVHRAAGALFAALAVLAAVAAATG